MTDGSTRQQQLAACAHDLRSALTVIAGYASLLGRPDIGEERRAEAVAGIEAAVARANGLVGEVLAGESRETEARATGLAPLARQAAADVRAATGRDVDVRIEDEPVISADPLGIARVLENLLNNAAKYSPDTEPIVLRVGSESDFAFVEVSDRGPGIPDAEKTAVFEPFARLDRDVAAPGTGLGLTVVRGVIDAVGGQVRITDREGGGTTVRLEVPTA